MQFPLRGSLEKIEESNHVLFDDHGLIPFITQYNTSFEALMPVEMSQDELAKTIDTGMPHYWSHAQR